MQVPKQRFRGVSEVNLFTQSYPYTCTLEVPEFLRGCCFIQVGMVSERSYVLSTNIQISLASCFSQDIVIVDVKPHGFICCTTLRIITS